MLIKSFKGKSHINNLNLRYFLFNKVQKLNEIIYNSYEMKENLDYTKPFTKLKFKIQTKFLLCNIENLPFSSIDF